MSLNTIDKDKNYVKGIVLTGYIAYGGNIEDFTINYKVLIKYDDSNNERKTIIYRQ